MCFDPVARVCVITMRQRIYLYDNFSSWEFFICLTPFLSGIVWINKLKYFDERICFPNNGCHVNRKKAIF